MPTKYEMFDNCIVYDSNGNTLGNLRSLQINTTQHDDIPIVYKKLEHNKEISFTCSNFSWFPDVLGKHQHYILHSKSVRVRNKHMKMYDKLSKQQWSKYFGISY